MWLRKKRLPEQLTTNGYGASIPATTGEINEDDFLSCDQRKLYIVCDGSGDDEIAELVIEEVANHISKPDSLGDAHLQLVSAIETVNSVLYQTQQKYTSTIVAILFFDSAAVVASVGNSRCYLLRGTQLRQLTKDHMLATHLANMGAVTEQEAKQRWGKTLSRGLGWSSGCHVDSLIVPVYSDDTFLLCSDGVSDVIDIDLLRAWLTFGQKSCMRIIDAARSSARNDDDVTAVVIRVSAL